MTAAMYGLPDTMQYLEHPWKPDRWRSHCRNEISDHWDIKLRDEAISRTSAQFADLESLSTSTPMRIWQQAGLSCVAVKEATVVSWMYCGTYFTRQLLFNMKKIKSPACACDKEMSEDICHFLLHCGLYDNIRQQYIPKYIQMNSQIINIVDNENLLLISIFDPLSSKLPENISNNWSSVRDVYELSRIFCHRMHLKREKIYEELDNSP